jgi:hypothetical protein
VEELCCALVATCDHGQVMFLLTRLNLLLLLADFQPAEYKDHYVVQYNRMEEWHAQVTPRDLRLVLCSMCNLHTTRVTCITCNIWCNVMWHSQVTPRHSRHALCSMCNLHLTRVTCGVT